MIDLNKIDLRKKMVFDLTKQKGIADQKAQVALCMDISGSMQGLYQLGVVQETLERIVPLAMQFDDNQEFELYMFEDKCRKHNNNVTAKNVDGIVRREILGKYSFGGTNYAPPIKMIIDDYAPSGKGFLGLGKKSSKLKYPVYVIFITDGENFDKTATEVALREASKHGIFFQFVGIGTGTTFSFLKNLDNLSGRLIDNANFFHIPDLEKIKDEELYDKLLNEFPSWLPLAKQNGLIE